MPIERLSVGRIVGVLLLLCTAGFIVWSIPAFYPHPDALGILAGIFLGIPIVSFGIIFGVGLLRATKPMSWIGLVIIGSIAMIYTIKLILGIFWYGQLL